MPPTDAVETKPFAFEIVWKAQSSVQGYFGGTVLTHSWFIESTVSLSKGQRGKSPSSVLTSSDLISGVQIWTA